MIPIRHACEGDLVVGAAFSGSDISQELLEHGAQAVYLSGRNWEDLAEGIVIENMQEVVKVPDVRKFVGENDVEFVNGQVVEGIDVVMYATGYTYSFPFFDGIDGIKCSVVDNRVENLYKHVFLPQLAPSLALVGIPWKVVPFPLFQHQARWIGMCLNGTATLPSVEDMMKDIENMYQMLGDAPKRYTHRFDAESQGAYSMWLAAQCGLEPCEGWPDWRRDLYIVSGMNRRKNGVRFREVDLGEIGAREAYEAFAIDAAEQRRSNRSGARVGVP